MTCEEVAALLPDWWSGSLPERKARAVEEHAGVCVSCYAKLDQLSRPKRLSPRLEPPAQLRATTLGAVRNDHRRRLLVRTGIGAVGVAAMALLFLMVRPNTKSATTSAGLATARVAAERARPSLRALDVAEGEIQDALLVDPDDPGLVQALDAIRRQREELTRLVSEAGS